jgi:hypothetical protein
MDSEASIQQGAERLMDIRMSLSELLGPDWKQKLLFPNVEAALKKEGLTTLECGEEVLAETASTELDRFVLKANEVFIQNGSSYRARKIKDREGQEKALIIGKVGEDIFYQTTRITDFNENLRCVYWTPETIGLVSENGQVLRLDKLLQPGEGILFIQAAGRKYRASTKVTSELRKIGVPQEVRVERDVIVGVPENFYEMGVFLHELGHLLWEREILKDPQLSDTFSEALDEFRRTSKTGFPVNPTSK